MCWTTSCKPRSPSSKRGDENRRAVAVAPNQPVLVVGLPEGDQGEPELPDGAEGPEPEGVLLQGPDELLEAAVAPRARMKAGEDAARSQAISRWKSRDMYWLPWSWRMARPRAASFSTLPKRSATPYRTGSSASWRAAFGAAGRRAHSAEGWSTATNTATWPCSTVQAGPRRASVPTAPAGAAGLGAMLCARDRGSIGAEAGDLALRHSAHPELLDAIVDRARRDPMDVASWITAVSAFCASRDDRS
jgi:hypothetical protein